VKVACIGPITARTAEELGFRVDVVADSYTIDGLVEAIQSIVYKTSQKKGD
jgi:uroporphyrinogen III methyltransferase/synthase